MNRRKKFSRPLGTREYKKVITIFPEGEKTEICYFTILKSIADNVHINIKKGDRKTQPNQILHRAKEYIRVSGLNKNEQIWLVIDVDSRPKNAFNKCLEWENTNKKQHKVAISNPKFEYWLLWHFEPGSGIQNSNDCETRLIKYLPNYTKSNLNQSDVTIERCRTAIQNGKQKHHNADIFEDNHSTVFKLVMEILGIT